MTKKYINEMKQFCHNLKVLYVEDSVSTKKSILELLEIFFKDIIVASNGQEGLDLFLKHRDIQVVITDINMPKKNGLDMVTEIKEYNENIFILIISAYEEVNYLMQSIKIRVNDYLLKPVTTIKFMDTIEKIYKTVDEENDICSELSLNINNNVLSYKDMNIVLRKREKEFLKLLANNKNSITSYLQIEEVLWIEKPMTAGALKTFIKEIRDKIPIDIIQNISKEGYKLKKSLNIYEN